MARENATRHKLICEGLKGLIAHGYEGVGIGPILASVDVPKGSFYHFFKSKDDFVGAIIAYYAEIWDGRRNDIFADARLSPLERLDAYLEVLEEKLREEHPAGGCLLGTLGQTISGRSAMLRARLAEAYRAWESSVARLLQEAENAGELKAGVDPQMAAVELIDAYEGAIIRVKLNDDLDAFARFRKLAITKLRRERDEQVRSA